MKLTRKEFLGTVAGAAVGSTIRSGASAAQSTAPAGRSKKVEGANIKGATAAVRKFIATTTLASMPRDVVEHGRKCLVDGFGVILAGSTVRGSEIVIEYVKSMSDKKEATAFGPGKLMAPVSLAALANGASGHAMDYD